MVYSRWRPDTGGYDYFESGERFGLGDDLPVPELPGGTKIGVPSISAGRMPKNGVLSPAGSGEEARGMIMPTSTAGLQGLGVLSTMSKWTIVALSAIAGAVAYHFMKEKA